MTKAAPFDTLRFAKNLAGSGLPRDQAETLVEQIALIRRNLATRADLTDFATKADLQGVRADLRHFATKADLQALKAELVMWMVGLLLAYTALLIWLLQLLE